jgi:hypothetical protein
MVSTAAKGTLLSETADNRVWCYWEMGDHWDHCWIVAGMPAEQKQLIHASQIAAHKTLSAPESPLSLCYFTDRERRGEWDCACTQNLNTCCFVACGKLTSASVLKAVMADWNRSNHFDTPCTFGPLRMMCCSYCPIRGAGVGTGYVLNTSGFELLETIDFPLNTPPEQSSDPLRQEGIWRSLPRVKRPGRGVNHPPQSSAEVRNCTSWLPARYGETNFAVVKIRWRILLYVE